MFSDACSDFPVSIILLPPLADNSGVEEAAGGLNLQVSAEWAFCVGCP